MTPAKTDFLIIGTRQQLEKTSIKSIIIGDTVTKPLESVRNLGSWFDAQMRMNVHIGKIWLPVTFGIQFKLLLFVYKSLPSTRVHPILQIFYSWNQLLIMLFVRLQNLFCSFQKSTALHFAHAAPVLWNLLPL